jgi:hypothetical protein
MTRNVGTTDKAIRVIIGLGLLSLIFLLKGGARWIGLVGLLPLLTACVGFCPLYPAIKVDTRRTGDKPTAG